MMRAPHGRDWGHYVLGTILNVTIFVAVGPVVGAIVFFALSSVWVAGISGTVQGALSGPLLFVVFLPFSVAVAYVKGWLAAGTTGLLVAVASSGVANVRALYALAIAAGGVFSLLFLWIEDRTIGEGAVPVAIVFLVGAVAALVCTGLARSFRLSKSVAVDEIAHASRVAQ